MALLPTQTRWGCHRGGVHTVRGKGVCRILFCNIREHPYHLCYMETPSPYSVSWFENPSPKGCAIVAGGPVFNWYISLPVLAVGEQLLLSDLWSNRLWTTKPDPEQDYEKKSVPGPGSNVRLSVRIFRQSP